MHYAKNGMVATSQPLAAQAGLDIIRRGGNAVDAAIATAAALTVVEPTSNGIGGDAFALVWMEDKLHGLNASGKAPQSISIDAVQKLGHTEMPKMGVVPITVPGAPAGWAELNRRFGKLTLAECLAPAVTYAREGFPLSPVVAKFWRYAVRSYGRFKDDPAFASWFDVFAPNGKAPAEGEMWSSAGHAATLEEIGRTNADSFYKGGIAAEIASYVQKHGGFLTAKDLVAFTPTWDTPISANYRGYEVWEMPPNGQGLVALIALNILKNYEFGKIDAQTYHKQFEAIKLAFTAGKAVITDPAHMQVDVSELLSDKYTQKLCAQITATAANPAPILPDSGGTVFLCTADGDGNMVSYIQSNYMGFGSGIVIPGTGIAMQNRGSDFSLDPAHANSLQGGKKTFHTIIPGFMTKNGRPVGPFGVMGGYMQPQGHVQVVMNTVDFGMSPQAALDATRWQWTKGKAFDIEPDFPLDIAAQLSEMGHQINMKIDKGGFGRGQIIWRDENGVLQGGTEMRCDGSIAMF